MFGTGKSKSVLFQLISLELIFVIMIIIVFIITIITIIIMIRIAVFLFSYYHDYVVLLCIIHR